jgi:glycosyltransferase involved in cell wall biosynthesis
MTKISIITPTLNHSRFIEDTILSVKNQDYQFFEHIIIDGGSSDGTIEILAKYPHLKWISEKDTGQSNAINKGFRMSTGDILAWINSDDYYDSNIFSSIVKFFEENKDCSVVYGDMTDIDENGNILGMRTGEVFTLQRLLKNPDVVRQPVCFWRRAVLKEVGYLDENLHLVMDYDYFLRFAKRYRFCHMARNLCFFRMFSGTKTSRLAKQQISEIKYVMKRESGGMPFRFYIFMLWRLYQDIRIRILRTAALRR